MLKYLFILIILPHTVACQIVKFESHAHRDGASMIMASYIGHDTLSINWEVAAVEVHSLKSSFLYSKDLNKNHSIYCSQYFFLRDSIKEIVYIVTSMGDNLESSIYHIKDGKAIVDLALSDQNNLTSRVELDYGSASRLSVYPLDKLSFRLGNMDITTRLLGPYLNIKVGDKSQSIYDPIGIKDSVYKIEYIDLISQEIGYTAYNKNSRITGSKEGMYIDTSQVNIVLHEFQLSAIRHSYTIFHFWGSWCDPCVDELEKNEKFFNYLSEAKGSDLRIINIGLLLKQSDINSYSKYVNRYYKTFENIHIKGYKGFNPEILKLLNITTYPTKIIVDENGQVIYHSDQSPIDDIPSILKL